MILHAAPAEENVSCKPRASGDDPWETTGVRVPES